MSPFLLLFCHGPLMIWQKPAGKNYSAPCGLERRGSVIIQDLEGASRGEERFQDYSRSGRGQQRTICTFGLRGEVPWLFKIWQGPAEKYLYLWTGEERFREYLRSGRGQQRRGEVLRLFKIWQGPAENYLYMWTGVDEYDFTIRYMSLIRVNCCNKGNRFRVNTRDCWSSRNELRVLAISE